MAGQRPHEVAEIVRQGIEKANCVGIEGTA
jgi:hypothetical protein